MFKITIENSTLVTYATIKYLMNILPQNEKQNVSIYILSLLNTLDKTHKTLLLQRVQSKIRNGYITINSALLLLH